MSDLDEWSTSELSSLHESLLLECEDPQQEAVVHSAPSTPVLVRWGAFDLLRPRSLPSSPTNLGSGVRTSSMKDLIQIFDTYNSSSMVEKAKSEAANSHSHISLQRNG